MRPWSNVISFRCELHVDTRTGEKPCPVRFEWVGPARERHTPDDEMRDARSALNAAEELGWWFGNVLTACPRHAAPIAPDALESEEIVRG